MMKPSLGLPIVIAALAVNLSACSYIKSWFPDKEKDYQYTTEIPPLAVPSELTDNPVFTGSKAASAETASQAPILTDKENTPLDSDTPSVSEATGENLDAPVSGEKSLESESMSSEPTGTEAEPQSTETVPAEPESGAVEPTSPETSLPDEAPAPVAQSEEKPAEQTEKIPADLIVYDDGETRLRIGTEKAIAWRMVGKALSRNSIEVIDRNQEDGSYEVHYDPDEQQFEDESFWDEIKFVFSGFESNDKQFLLKLIETNRQTDVAIVSKDAKPVMNRAGLRLLKVIQKTINTDQAK